MNKPPIDGQVLDTFEFALGRNFPAWLGKWRHRWLTGERITVLVDEPLTHVIVVADPDAKQPAGAK